MPRVDDEDLDVKYCSIVRAAELVNDRVEANGQPAGVEIACNFLDLARVSPFLRESLFGPGCARLDGKRGAIRIDKSRADEAAVAFCKDVPLLEAACICDVIRSHDRKVGDFPTRVYLFRKAWSKLPGAALLSVMSNGRPILNPAVFKTELAPGEAEPPPQEAIDFGEACGAGADTEDA